MNKKRYYVDYVDDHNEDLDLQKSLDYSLKDAPDYRLAFIMHTDEGRYTVIYERTG